MKTLLKITAACTLLAILLAGCNIPNAAPTASTPSLEPNISPTALPQVTATAAAASTDTPSAPTAPPATATSAPLPTSTTGAAVPVTVTDTRMFDSNSGWGVGEYQAGIQDILRTSDGGKTWKIFSPAEPNRTNLTAVTYFQDPQTAWVIYTPKEPDSNAKSFAVWHTTDGGATWQSSTVNAGDQINEFFIPGQIAFSDANNGWILVHMGVGMSHDYISIWKTGDGGATWTAVVDPAKDNLTMSCSKDGIWFRDPQNGYAAGSCFGVMKGLLFYQTDDGGNTWSLVNLPPPAGSPDVFTQDSSVCEADHLVFTSAESGQVLVRCSDMSSSTPVAKRWMYTTADGGKNWSSTALPGAWGELDSLDQATGWYLAQPAADQTKGTKVFHTTDGGKTWQQVGMVNWDGPVNFVDEKTGWVVASTGIGQAVALVRSQNGGVSWELLNTMVEK